MIFCSPVFLFLFLPAVLGAYFLTGARGRNLILLGASLFFYAWGEFGYILVLLTSIVVNYSCGRVLGRLRERRRLAGFFLALAVAVNLALLVTFKYAGFLVELFNQVLGFLGFELRPPVNNHLPLGISFFTFHALSYVIDVYRGEVPALKDPLNFALYISFFPQSIAGPIVRYADVAGQLTKRVVTREGFADGVRRFILGLAKKMLIANTLAGPADGIFGLEAEQLTSGLAWLGIVCYTLQIYFDFSGYSDMAIGLAAMFGFRFRENFNYPYVAASITDFWRRWHISLSTWYRDYLYIPLGGNRRGTARTYLNLLIVFCLCGLWHGANGTFLLWGLFHGAFLVLERTGLGRRLPSLPAPLRHGYVLLVVMVGWVFFRAGTLAQTLAFLAALAGFAQGEGIYSVPLYLNAEVGIAIAAAVLGSMPVLPWAARWYRRIAAPTARDERRPGLQTALAFVPVAMLALLLGLSAMYLAGRTYNPFIYFRF